MAGVEKYPYRPKCISLTPFATKIYAINFIAYLLKYLPSPPNINF